jgi:3-methyladenine DNA glycosylase AlkC
VVVTVIRNAVGKTLVRHIAARIEEVYPEFDTIGFVGAASASMTSPSVIDRLDALAMRLAANLPPQFPVAVRIVQEAAAVDPTADIWEGAAFNAYVARHGLADPREALDALEVFTSYASSEMAVRSFLARYGERTWARVDEWSADARPEVRRLAVTCTRPRLPWGPPVPGLAEQPERSLTLLDRLCDDPDPAVRRAVADHLFEVAVDHPDEAVATVLGWRDQGRSHALEVAAHGLRGLVSQGHAPTLELLGYTRDASLDVVEFWCEPCLLGRPGAVELRAALRSTSDAPQRFVIDYVVHYATESGGNKAFRWRTLELAPGEGTTLHKRHCSGDLRISRSERGHPRVELRVAGETVAETVLEPTRAPD